MQINALRMKSAVIQKTSSDFFKERLRVDQSLKEGKMKIKYVMTGIVLPALMFLMTAAACLAEMPAGQTEAIAADSTGSGLPDAAAETGRDLTPRIGIISAMDNEISLLLDNAEIEYVQTVGGEEFHVGTLCGQDVVIAKAGIGKIRSASGITAMLNSFEITEVLFTGIAGGVGDDTEVLDIVVATDLVQHDYGQLTNHGFEWLPERGEKGYYPCSEELIDQAYAAASEVVGPEHVFKGTIATGDQFVASEEYVKTLQDQFNALACEMEGASIAIVCTQYDVPFVVIRSMSDKADGLAHETYNNMADTAADHSGRIIMKMLEEDTAAAASDAEN